MREEGPGNLVLLATRSRPSAGRQALRATLSWTPVSGTRCEWRLGGDGHGTHRLRQWVLSGEPRWHVRVERALRDGVRADPHAYRRFCAVGEGETLTVVE